jgi:hypothetical protein
LREFVKKSAAARTKCVGTTTRLFPAADIYRGAWRSLNRMIFNVARVDLLIASCWLLGAIGEFKGSYWLAIPLMARIHGPLNGVGFVLLGLLAWVTENSYRAQRFEQLVHEIDRKSVRISALRRLSS